jgi:ClpP class serine protease
MHWVGASLIWSKSTGNLTTNAWPVVADARVFLADAAVTVGLVDKIGYLQDAIDEAKVIAAPRCRCPGGHLPPNRIIPTTTYTTPSPAAHRPAPTPLCWTWASHRRPAGP